MTAIALDPHVEAVLALVRTATRPDAALIPCGDGVAPRSATQALDPPYNVLYLRPGGWTAGSLGTTTTDLYLRFQVTSVGSTAREARGIADRTALVVEGATVTVTGRGLVAVGRPAGAAPIANASRDPQVPNLFYVPVEYRLWTVPA